MNFTSGFPLPPRPIVQVGELRFALLTKEELTERHGQALYDAGALLKLVHERGDEDLARSLLVHILDTLSPGLPSSEIDKISDQELLNILGYWSTMPDPIMPPAVGRLN